MENPMLFYLRSETELKMPDTKYTFSLAQRDIDSYQWDILDALETEIFVW